MSNRFYKTRKNRLVAGVVAGLADKFGWDLALARILAIILMISTQFGIFLYLERLSRTLRWGAATGVCPVTIL